MSAWKQISWRDAVGKTVFDDELGFVYVNESITYNIGEKNISAYYEEDSQNQKIRLHINTADIAQVKALFSKRIYDAQVNYYRAPTNFVPLVVETISPVISYRRVQNQNNNVYGCSDMQHAFSIDKKNKGKLDYLRYVWICDEIQTIAKSDLRQPLLKDLKTGDNFFCNMGKGKITKFYPQPNENNLMFQAALDFEGGKKTPFDVSFADKIYVLPYEEQPISETQRFNESKNEICLSPYAVAGTPYIIRTYGGGEFKTNINIYWNKIDIAASYIVSLYKELDRPYLQRVYHLKDYIVDRNDGFLAIDNLLGGGYIITVKAENRNGEEIALSRGIKIGNNGEFFPKYFKEK